MTKDGGDLVGLADGAVGIQQSLAQLVQCSAPVKDQVVTIFHLGEKEPMLTAATFAFAFFEEGSQTDNHFCPQLSRSWAVKESANCYELAWMTAFEEGIGTLLKIDA